MATEVELVKLSALTQIARDLADLTAADRKQTGLDVISSNNNAVLALAANEAAEAAASVSGSVHFYDTFADAEAAVSGLTAGDIVEVMADETLSGLRTRYLVESPAALAFRLLLSPIVTATAAALRAVPYSSALSIATTLGYRAANDGGGGTWYWDSVSARADNGGTVVLPTGHAGNGRWIRVGAFSEPSNPLWWGAYRNKTNAAATRSAIQHAIDWALYQGTTSGQSLGRVTIPNGLYLVNESLFVGYGPTAFKGCIIEGDGQNYDGSVNFSGTAIFTTCNDRPVFSISNGRNIIIRSLYLEGLNYSYINSNNLGYLSPAIDDLTDSSWVDPALPASASSRYAPYCAIAIDPYSGTKPTTAYPDIVFPDWWTGATTQYGRSYSSNCYFEDLAIRGFVVGIANQPSNAGGQGELTKLERVHISYCQYAVSIGNPQSRLVHARNCLIDRVHTGFVTTKHGKQIGKPSISCESTGLRACIQWFDIPNLAYGGVPKFDHCYGEIVYKIGFAGSNAAKQTPFTIENCEIEFASSWADRGVPASVLSLNGPSPFSIRNCRFDCGAYYMAFALRLYSPDLFEFVQNELIYNETQPTSTATIYALRATDGVTFGAARVSNNIWPRKYSAKNSCSTLAWMTALKTITIWEHIARANAVDEGIPVGIGVGLFDKNTSSVSVSGRVVSFTSTLALTDKYQKWLQVGDIVMDTSYGHVLVITSVVSNTITAKAMTGFDVDDNLIGFTANSGHFITIPGRVAHTDPIAAVKLQGDTTAGNNTMSAIGRLDGVASSAITSVIAAGDYVLTNQYLDYPIAPAGAAITAVDPGNASFTVTGTFIASATKRRLPFIIKASLPNE